MSDILTPTVSADSDDLLKRLVPIIVDIRQRRKPTEEQWLLYHAAYRGISTRRFFKSDTFNHFLPAARRSVEKFTIRGAQMLVPSSDFFEVYPGESPDAPSEDQDRQCEAVKAYLQYVWAKKIKVYGFVRKLLRSWCLFGRCIAKAGIEVVDARYIDRRGKSNKIQQVWPTARVVDPFAFFVFPETETDIDKASIIAEDFMMPYDSYVAQAGSKNKFVDMTPIAQSSLVAPVWPDYDVRRLQQQNMSTPGDLTMSGGDQGTKDSAKKLIEFVAGTEVWYRQDGNWRMAWIAWNVTPGPQIVRRQTNPYPRHPYRFAAARDLVGEQYSTGMMDDLEPLQTLLNDEVNMTLEGQATQFSPPAVIDPDLVSRPGSLVFRPRAKWFMKPDGVKWLEPKDTFKVGITGIQFTMGLMDQFTGSSPLAEGQPVRNMPRAGFAMTSMMNQAMGDIKDAATMIEDNILTPLCSDFYRYMVEFVPEKQRIRIPGGQDWASRTMTPQDLYGDFTFQWVGSVQAQDFQVRSQRLVTVLGLLLKGGQGLGQQLQQEGKTMDWEYLFKRIFREGLGERGLTQFIRKMTPEEQQAVAQAMQAQQAMAQQPKKSISLRGEVDPITSKVLAQGGDPASVPPEAALLVGDSTPSTGRTGATRNSAARAPASGGGESPQAPASQADVNNAMAQTMTPQGV